MKRLISTLAILAVGALWAPVGAQASFGLYGFDISFRNADGTSATQAGSHPYAMRLSVGVNFSGEGQAAMPDGRLRDLALRPPPGFVGDATAYPRCPTLDFLTIGEGGPSCLLDTVVGITANSFGEPGVWAATPVFNLPPPPGVLVRLGFNIYNTVNVIVDVGIDQSPPYGALGATRNTSEILEVYGNVTELWGVPSDPGHDELRGKCGFDNSVSLPPGDLGFEFENTSGETCPVPDNPRPFLTVPGNCTGAPVSSYEVLSWEGDKDAGSSVNRDPGGNPLPLSGCGKLGFKPAMSARPTTESAESGSGIDFSLEIKDEGLTSVAGLAQSEVKEAVVTLPEGMTINPSIAEGLGICTPAELARESAVSSPGSGCPDASKIGIVRVDTPLLSEPVSGSVFLAQQDDPATTAPGAENPFDTMIAFYVVIQSPKLGLSVKVPAKIAPDPRTGQLIVTVEDVPQLPFSRFNLRFREGLRSPLITPPACGTYTTVAELTPWADPSKPLSVASPFKVTSGVGGGPCPPGGVPPFAPDYEAGSINNNAGAHSPFYMRLIRHDGEQDMTKFSSVLPPGVVGSLRGVEKCPDAAAGAAREKTGRQELASPSCPANAKIGRTLAGAGVGGGLVYVPGHVYLGGPYKGAPLSVIAITPAVAGPFDGGTVVVREGLDLNPITAEVEVDGAASDPIPHILNGIPLKMRDLRVYVDRENFILNPTSCDPSSAKATLFGSYLDVFSPADDVPVDLSARYQAASCLNLPFKPRLALNLKGGIKRGGHPGLKAIFTPRPGDANTSAARATLPRSAFLDQAHIRTICTRVQFAAEQCPPGSVYGFAKAWTPLLDEPFEGPVILRSSDNKLPDLVLALKGIVDINVVSRIDSKNGGIRNTFDVIPDAPVSKFVLTLQGGKKGLIVNSRDLCKGRISRADIRFTAHNGRVANLRPKLQPQCGGKRKGR
ncbi:MAG TPA: hypothetical protein VF729_01170 [Solirubrobacterales bacterium]